MLLQNVQKNALLYFDNNKAIEFECLVIFIGLK